MARDINNLALHTAEKVTLRIKIPQEPLKDRADDAFESLLMGTKGWKYVLFDLHKIAESDPTVFEDNARDGLHYLLAFVWCSVCPRCDDDAMDWLHRFAKAWLLREDPLPVFVDCTCSD